MSREDHLSQTESGSKLRGYLRDGWTKGKEKMAEGWLKSKQVTTEELSKHRVAIERSIGLGAQPNVIPSGDAHMNEEPRTVELGWHPVPGIGKWLAEKSSLGKVITKSIGKYPDPTQHWAVLVGDYAHELWMDEKLDVIYINEKIDRAKWHTFDVGKTRFTDQALKEAAEMVIHDMRAARAAYNLINNNCQNFALNLLDTVQVGAHHKFATCFAVYQAATGSGTIKDLFVDPDPLPELPNIKSDPPIPSPTHTVQIAQQVMDEHTVTVDDNSYWWSR